MLKGVDFFDFVKNLFFYNKHDASKPPKKSLTVFIGLNILSAKIVELSESIQNLLSKSFSWITGKYGDLDKKTNEVAKSSFKSNGLNIVKEPVRYQKQKKDGLHPAPRNKQNIVGQGINGHVYEHKNDKNTVVKFIQNINEYEIGAMLNHPTLVKIYGLFIKEYPGDRYDKYKLVMEKINGRQLTSVQYSPEAISKKIAIQLIEQAKECCLYLFQSGVYWKDLNDGNFFIEDKTNNLKIIDFGCWRKESNRQELTKHLLLGAMELTGWVVGNSSCVKHNGIKDREKKKEIAFPEKFFHEKIPNVQIISLFPDLDSSWMKRIANELQHMNEDEMQAFLGSYFDHVIANLHTSNSLD